MAIIDVLTTVKLQGASGLPHDVYVNDFAFTGYDTGNPTMADEVTTAIADAFYNNAGSTAGVSVGYLLSPGISRAADGVTVDIYDLTGHLDGSPHGSPIATRSFTLDASGDIYALPEEVAIALSIHGDLSGVVERQPNPAYPPTLPKFFRPAARRRGRLFIGPLALNQAITESGESRVSTQAKTVLTYAATALWDVFAGGWCVWSRADETLYSVTGGWVDDAFDTQRRRGDAPLSRTLWPV